MSNYEKNVEEKLLHKFEVEELEKRYEFGWVNQVKVSATYEGYGPSVTFEV